MSVEVRLGRKETKRSRTAREQQTYERHKPVSKRRKRKSRSVDFGALFEKHGLPGIAEFAAFQDALIREYRFGSIAAAGYPAAIFDPALEDMARLPLGLLDEKEAALPPDLIPDREADLTRLCRRLIIRNQDQDVIDAVLSGWSGFDRSELRLDQHAADLLELERHGPVTYRTIVGGQHRQALKDVQRLGLLNTVTRDAIERFLVVHGLLWCTNDLQMNLARAARAERNPLDQLVESQFRQLQPARVVNDLRPQLALMRLLLQRYVTTQEEKGADARTPLDVLPTGPGMRSLGARIKTHAAAHGIDLMSLRSALDGLVPELRAQAHDRDDLFWQILDRPAEEAGLPTHFTGVWFSGLSVLQCAAVTVLRYMQAEQEIVGMVRAHMTMVLDGAFPSGPLKMRRFARRNLTRGWEERAKLLLNLYRRELLDDKDYPRHSPEDAGMGAITKAASWLERQPPRRIEDHDEKAGRDRRTLYLLDVIPEARLAR